MITLTVMRTEIHLVLAYQDGVIALETSVRAMTRVCGAKKIDGRIQIRTRQTIGPEGRLEAEGLRWMVICMDVRTDCQTPTSVTCLLGIVTRIYLVSIRVSCSDQAALKCSSLRLVVSPVRSDCK